VHRTTEPTPAVDIVEPQHEPFTRAPGDVVRVVVAAVVFLASLVIAAIFTNLIRGAEQDLVDLANRVPSPASKAAVWVSQVVTVIGVFPLVVALVIQRRFRVLSEVAVAAIVASAGTWVVSEALALRVEIPVTNSFLRSIGYPGARDLAVAAAIITVISPWFSRPWRRTFWAILALIAFARIVTGSDPPYDIGIAVSIGWLAASIVALLFGSPNLRPRGDDVVASLHSIGVHPRRLEWLGIGGTGSSIWLARDGDDHVSFLKVFSSGQRDADLLVRAWRWLRVRDPVEERAFTSLRREVEHEALMVLKANDDGIPTARLAGVAEVDPDGMLLALDYVEGRTLDALPSDDITDELLDELWQIVGRMRLHGLAHRGLRAAHVVVRESGEVAIVDFGSGEVAANRSLLRNDIAELLCSTAVLVGAPRAVAAAVRALGADDVGDALPRLQLLVLTDVTRREVKATPGLLRALQAEVQTSTGVEQVRYEELARVRPRVVFTWVMFAVALYILLPQLANVSDLWGKISSASLPWVLGVVAATLVTYIGAALGMIGSVPDRVRVLPMLWAQTAASFVNRLSPASVGGMALNVRFLQKRGVDSAVAVTGVGVNAAAGLIVHLLLLAGFVVTAGSTTSGPGFSAPSGTLALLAVSAVFLVAGVALAVPQARRTLRVRLWPRVKDAGRGLGTLARRPDKLAALVGGSALVTLGYLVAFVCAIYAVGGDLPLASVGTLYLAAAAVASAAPTPGGLGALEAALIAGLNSLGLSPDASVSAVFIFRGISFWLPILPGWYAVQDLQRRDEL
jgi:undecaprenyl-diphosphatase